MNIEIGISLIVLAFIIPIVIVIVYKRVKARRILAKIKEGEIINRDEEEYDVIKEGKKYEIKVPRIIANKQNGMKSFEAPSKSKGDQFEILFFFEDPTKRKLKIIPNIADIAADINQIDNNFADGERGSNQKLEEIPEEEEKMQEMSGSQNNNDITIQADLSEIQENKKKKTPAFQNKGVINFYESASDDMSMLKEIMSNQGGSQQNLDVSQISQKQPQVIYKTSPFKLQNTSNIQDKSTDCLMSNSKDRIPQQQFRQSNLQQDKLNVNYEKVNQTMGDESSIDVNVFDEKVKDIENKLYHQQASKHQQRTKKLFQTQMVRPFQIENDITEGDIEIQDDVDITAEVQLIQIQLQEK